LVGRESGVEADQDLVPQGVEAFPLDGVDHRLEGLRVVQIGVGVDRVDVLVVGDGRGGRVVRQLLHVDGDLRALVESWHLTGSAVRAGAGGGRGGGQRGGRQARRRADGARVDAAGDAVE